MKFCWVWWCVPVTRPSRRLRQEDVKCEPSLGSCAIECVSAPLWSCISWHSWLSFFPLLLYIYSFVLAPACSCCCAQPVLRDASGVQDAVTETRVQGPSALPGDEGLWNHWTGLGAWPPWYLLSSHHFVSVRTAWPHCHRSPIPRPGPAHSAQHPNLWTALQSRMLYKWP